MPDAKTRVRRLAGWSIVVAFGVMALKFTAWWITGSVALYSDALESIVNVIAGIAAFWAISVSHRPADSDHQHGHHKAEYISAVVEGVLIVVAALLILTEVWSAIRQPTPMEAPGLGLAVNMLATAVNGVWATVLIRNGRAARSPALEADGHHVMTDVITSVGVLAGLVGAILTGWWILDPLLAMIVALNILWQGGKVIGSSVDGLMDRAVPEDERERIAGIIEANAQGAMEIHDLKTRIAGRATFIEFHMVVDALMSVGTSHRICDRIETALARDIPSVRVLIHVEPDDEAKLPDGGQKVSIG